MKQTEIGLIPDDWEVKEIKDFADVITGNKNTQDAVENGKYPFYVRSPIVERINDYSFDSEGIITAGDGVGTGKVFHYAKGKFGLHQRAYLIHNFKDVEPKYFYFNFSKNFYERVHSMTAKSSVDSVRREMITKMQIPIPPTLAEQQRIANALSDVDALISTTEKLIQKKKNIKQGAMQNLLTGKKRLPGFGEKQADLFVPNGTHTKKVKDVSPEQIRLSTKKKQTELGEIPEDWGVKSLGDIFSIKHGYGFEGQFFSSENNQHIVVTPGNFKLEGGFQKQKQPIYYTGTYPDEFKLKPNDLIIMMTDLSKNSDTLGNPAIVPDDGNDYLHNQRIGLIQIHNDSFVKDYIYLLLCTKEYHEAVVSTAAGSTVKHTSPNRIYSINLVVSTSKKEQTAIANVLSSMDKEIETLNTKLEKYRNLKTAMMQQLLTGKIRLVK